MPRPRYHNGVQANCVPLPYCTASDPLSEASAIVRGAVPQRSWAAVVIGDGRAAVQDAARGGFDALSRVAAAAACPPLEAEALLERSPAVQGCTHCGVSYAHATSYRLVGQCSFPRRVRAMDHCSARPRRREPVAWRSVAVTSCCNVPPHLSEPCTPNHAPSPVPAQVA